MAESQLVCMEDGRIGVKVPESRPEFYYSEEQRAAIEELLKNGDGAFKMRLLSDKMTDFLSAREVKLLLSSFKRYDTENDDGSNKDSQDRTEKPESDVDSGVQSTYWPQMSDTEVPLLDIGWPSGGFFRGVTKVAVYTHPPKEPQGPHIKEVVRRLIQEATKVIAVVMDIVTDPHILQDLMDAASRRSVPVYILLDNQAVPHFLDMCSRLQISSQHLRNIRARSLQGVGFGLSFGRLPGSLCYKYMLVDGEKVMFGSYSFSWCTSRMDRNMITVMTGQVVDFYDHDFRELYAISEKLNLYKEFNVTPPTKVTTTVHKVTSPKRPSLPATTSRFQVALGDSPRVNIEIPAHKFHNPKYLLALGDIPRPTGSLQERGPRRGPILSDLPSEMEIGRSRLASSERLDHPPDTESLKSPTEAKPDKKGRAPWAKNIFKKKNKPSGDSVVSSPCPSPDQTHLMDETEDDFVVIVKSPPKSKARKHIKLGRKADSVQTVSVAHDNESVNSHPRRKQACAVS
ncbi:uncharacterized protein V6R79_022827 [Siganus canaliculatus]